MSEKKFYLDMWYNDDVKNVDKITVCHNDLNCTYSGNCYIKGKCVGDYSTKDSNLIEKHFPQIKINWDGDWEPMDACDIVGI